VRPRIGPADAGVLVWGVRAALMLVLAAALTMAIPGAARATVFANGGWGWWIDQGDAAALARGGTSVAVNEYGASGAVNPATIAGAERPYGFAAYQGETWKVKGDGQEYKQHQDLLPEIGGVLRVPNPYSSVRIGLLFRPLTDASFERVRIVDADTSAYLLEQKGSGGWNRLQVMLAGRTLGDRFDWGVAVGRTIGTVKIESAYTFVTGTQGRLRNSVEGRLTGAWVGTAGAVVRPDPRIAVGGSLTAGGSSRLIQESRVIEGGSYDQSWEGQQELPTEWAIGVQAKPVSRYSVSADYKQVLWGGARMKPTPEAAYTTPFDDMARWGIGIERMGGGAKPRIVLRAGYMQAQSYLSAVDGTRVVEKALTFGGRWMGLHDRSAFDLSIELGKRGDESTLGVAESFARFTVGVNFSSSMREY
jgi:hypothetical protein